MFNRSVARGRLQRSWVLGLLAVGSGASALAGEPGQVVDNFRLLDQAGKSHELYYLSDMKAVVLMVQGNGCEAARKSVPRLEQIREAYGSRGVAVLMLNSNLGDNRARIAAEMQQLGSTIPVLVDELQLIGESLEATRAGEVLVLNPEGWKVAYRGPIDSEVAGKKAGSNYLADALDALLAAAPVKTAKVAALGCPVSMPEREARAAHAKISYAEAIAPVLIDRCVVCHRAGGIAPWSMTSYDMIKGFAPMIREVLRTERMPPWHADPHYGVFKNDRSLSSDQVKTLVHWIEAGTPRGNGSDPLANLQRTWPEWELGPPNLLVETPSYTVPATGTIEYQNPVVKNTIGRDVWLRAIAFNPGDRAVVHHILAYAVKQGGGGTGLAALGTYLAGYVPGGGVVQFPADTGVLLPKDTDFRFQVHYTASGKESADVTKVGLYFTDEAPKYPLRQFVLLDPRLKIPPNIKEHRIVAPPRTFDRDVLLYSLTAHAHYRGKSSKFIAQYPDGREEVLLSVPK
jgi:mono/diheme cytochrome c family protein